MLTLVGSTSSLQRATTALKSNALDSVSIVILLIAFFATFSVIVVTDGRGVIVDGHRRIGLRRIRAIDNVIGL